MKSDPVLTTDSCPGENIPSIEEMLGPVIISLLSSVRTEMTSVKNCHFSGGQTESHAWACPPTDCPVSSSPVLISACT